MRYRNLLAAGAAGTLLVGSSAMAVGTLAVGLTDDFANDGVAFGVTWDYESTKTSDGDALDECYGFEDASQDVRDNCQVELHFKNQCVAIALDPEPGTLGVGWAVGNTPLEAQSAAMQKCRDASTSDRASYCAITESQCDTVG